MTTFERNNLIIQYLSFAESLAKKHFRTAPKGIELPDITSVAYFGLVDAASRYQKNRGAFTTYAFYRITGEIYSFIRTEVRFKLKYKSFKATEAQGVF